MIAIKKQSKLLYESANILCWYRIIISIGIAATTAKHSIIAVLFSLALISDALDGWCYRKFANGQPYTHWFNRLPMTMDPLADYCLVMGGIIHVVENKVTGIVIAVIVTVVNLLWQRWGKSGSDRRFAFAITAITYIWFFLMVLSVAGVWWRNYESHWLISFVVTMVIFYAIWFNTRVKERTIRRRG